MILYLQMIETDDDRVKFEKIYHLYRGLMFYVANRILQNEQDAEDAVHQAFLAIIIHLKKISEIDCPKTKSFVVIITENKAIDMIRERKHLSGHQQYLKNGENTDKFNVFSIFLCGGICMYVYVRYRVR